MLISVIVFIFYVKTFLNSFLTRYYLHIYIQLAIFVHFPEMLMQSLALNLLKFYDFL